MSAEGHQLVKYTDCCWEKAVVESDGGSTNTVDFVSGGRRVKRS